jgi:ankyrin repeat protein
MAVDVSASDRKPDRKAGSKEREVLVPAWMFGAIKKGNNARVIKWLEMNPAHRNAIFNNPSGVPLSLFMLCCRLGNEPIMDYLIANNAYVYDGLYGLMQFVDQFYMEQVYRLLPKLIDLAIKQRLNLEEFLEAAENNKQRFVSKLQELEIKQKNDRNKYSIENYPERIQDAKDEIEVAEVFVEYAQIAIESLRYRRFNQFVIENDLISKDVVDHNIKAFFELPQGDQATVHRMKQAIRENKLEDLTKILDENKKNIELTDERGYTPLLQAVYTNKIPAVKLLKNKGANLNAAIIGADGKMVNAFQLATMLDQHEMAQLLASYGLGIYKPDAKKEKDVIKEDTEKEKMDVGQQFKLLIAAIKNSNSQEAKKFLNHKTVNMADADGKTPLIVAALKGNKELVKIILGMVDTIQQQDRNGNTALHWAVINGHYAIARQLIEGRDLKRGDLKEVFITNKKQLSAYDLAKKDQKNKENVDYKLFMVAMEA